MAGMQGMEKLENDRNSDSDPVQNSIDDGICVYDDFLKVHPGILRMNNAANLGEFRCRLIRTNFIFEIIFLC